MAADAGAPVNGAARQGDDGRAPDGGRPPPGRVLAAFISVFGHAGIAALIVAIVLTCADIIWRRVVGGAFMDIYDITKLCLVLAASWSIPYAFVHGTHVSVELLVERFSPAIRLGLEIAASIAAAALLAFLLWLSWDAAQLRYRYGDTSPNLRIPMIYYWGVLLIGLLLSIIAALWRACAALGVLRAGAGPRP